MKLRKPSQQEWIFGVVMGLAVLLRFWDYQNRWIFNQDQARDATIALYAVRNGLVPEIGSPSSAGPFNFGPWYHWIIMGFEVLLGKWIMGPWIGFTILSVSTVAAYYLIGKKLGGKAAAVIMGLVAAVAVGMVENAPDMLNTVLVGWSSGWGLLFLVKMIEEKEWKWGIGAGFLIGLSMNFHFQALGLGALMAAGVLINNFKLKDKIKAGAGMAGGWLGAFGPLVIFDLKHNGVWIRSVIWYYTEGVKKFYVPVRWLTEIRDFWPQLFGQVTTGVAEVGYVLVVLGAAAVWLKRKELRKIPKSWWVVMVSLLVSVVLMRFYKGVRSREYLIAFHGYIIVMTGWIGVTLYQKQKWLGGLVVGGIVLVAMWQNWMVIKERPGQAPAILAIKQRLDGQIKGGVTIEQYQQSNMAAAPLLYLYYRENRLDNNGQRIAVCDGSKYSCPEGEDILEKNYRVYLKSQSWEKINELDVYKMLWVNYGWED